uniref:NADH-ubiquinone oxidoreductase chain 2 n=1 Tax=Bolivaritettix lativertex TaxID=470946 RepID=A0A6G6BKM9_9ORTH|nr:NADH dehydrogenase subunit 2 [Bolivaritettix lativertex]
MNKAPMKMLFIMLLIMSTLISTSSNNWLGVWMGLEINLLSYIPLITYNKNKNINFSGIKYFIIQSMASIVLIMSIISITINDSMNNNYMISIMSISILTKIGAAPMHFWFPEIMEQLDWNNCMLLMTWQKIAPMIILSYITPNVNLMNLFIMASAIVGAILGLNQISLRLILAYSSINHIAWMISALNYNLMIWWSYFLIYSLMTILIVASFKSHNIFSINEAFLSKNYNKINKINLMMIMLSLGGMPPLLGFLPKWLLIQEMMINFSYLTLFVLIISSSVTLYFYLKLFLSAGMILAQESKWNLTNYFLSTTEILSLSINLLTTMGLTLSMMILY